MLVLLAAYNGAAWIGQQIQTILAQEDVEVRLFIRDDGSSDATREEIARFLHDARVSLAPASEPTGSAAQNFLALIRSHDAGGYPFIAFADQDDIWYRDKLARACRTIGQSQSAGYSSGTTARWEDGRERYLAPSGPQNPSDFLFEGAGQGCTFVLSHDLYRRIREFICSHPELTRELHFHDWTMYSLARCWGLNWVFDPKPSMIYRQHSRNDTGARGSLQGAAKRLALIRSGWYRRQLENISMLCLAAAPENSRITLWHSVLTRESGWLRRIHLARFCLSGGRRRTVDNAVLILGSIAGWI